jgi:hypothetical protein
MSSPEGPLPRHPSPPSALPAPHCQHHLQTEVLGTAAAWATTAWAFPSPTYVSACRSAYAQSSAESTFPRSRWRRLRERAYNPRSYAVADGGPLTSVATRRPRVHLPCGRPETPGHRPSTRLHLMFCRAFGSYRISTWTLELRVDSPAATSMSAAYSRSKLRITCAMPSFIGPRCSPSSAPRAYLLPTWPARVDLRPCSGAVHV